MIDCSNVRFTYDGERFVLRGIDLHIADGEFVCILGGNGSGKSTLAKHMNALLVPDEGCVRVAGHDTQDEECVYDIRSTAGMVFQNPDDQLVASLVEDDVAFGPENLGVESTHIAERVKQALKEVGLVGFERHETHALSGGQKQRVAIAGVLAMEPRALILDEASSMLDPRGRKGLMRVCRELNDRGMTIIMITHYMEEAAAADRVVVMNEGRIACEGTPEEVLTQADELAALNLDVPYSCQLGLALQKAGMHVVPHVNETQMVAEIAAKLSEVGKLGEAGHAKDIDPAFHATAPAPSEDALLRFEDVFFTYTKSKKERKRKKLGSKPEERATWGNDPNEVWALKDISFELRRGEFLGIAGHTGSGKSTLLQHMNGLLQPSRGRVLVGGEDLADKKAAAAAKARIGIVFQYPERQLFATTVFDDVAFGPRNLGLSGDEVETRVRESLSRVGLSIDSLRDMSPFELSGGQQRRVAFAGVLAMNPEALVLDEPVAGLDPVARREFLELIAQLHKQGTTIVMVSHSMDDLAAMCDRVVVLKEGEIVRQGTPAHVFMHAAKLNEIGLGLPAPQRMAYALIDAGAPLSADELYSINSLAAEIASIAEGGAR